MKIHRIHGNRQIGAATRSEHTARHPIALISLVIALLLTPTMGQSLATGFDPDGLGERDAKTLEEIAAHSTAARHAALVVAGHPEVLLEIQKIQQSSADDFATLLYAHPRKTQETIWGLVRHRGLTAELGRGGRKTNTQLEKIAAAYPADDRAAIIEEGRDRYSLWVKIYALDLHVEQAFSMRLAPLPKDVREAFEDLTAYPDLATLLIDDMRTTTVLGASYRDDPNGVEDFLSTLHNKVADKRARDERDWADEIADPAAAEELETAARAFAKEYDYDLTDVKTDVDTEPTQNILVTHRVEVDPYPFWFGYPHWYGVAYWYPRPIWGHIGFHFGSGHTHARVGLPSLLFLDWYHGSYRTRGTNFRSRAGHSSSHRAFPRKSSTRRARYYDHHQPKISKGHRRNHSARVNRTNRDRNRGRNDQTRRTRREQPRDLASIRDHRKKSRHRGHVRDDDARTTRREKSRATTPTKPTASPSAKTTPKARENRARVERPSRDARRNATFQKRRTSATHRSSAVQSDQRRVRRAERAERADKRRIKNRQQRRDRSIQKRRARSKVRSKSIQRSSGQNRSNERRGSRRR